MPSCPRSGRHPRVPRLGRLHAALCRALRPSRTRCTRGFRLCSSARPRPNDLDLPCIVVGRKNKRRTYEFLSTGRLAWGMASTSLPWRVSCRRQRVPQLVS